MLKDKHQVQLLSQDIQNDAWSRSSLDVIIKETGVSNNTVKKIVDKYLCLSIEERTPFKLAHESIKMLAQRDDSYLFKTLLDNTKVIDAKKSAQINDFERFKECLKNSTNDCLKIAMDNNNERIAEFLIDKLIELNINDFDKKIITYDTFARLFCMQWFTEIEKILNSFCAPQAQLPQQNIHPVEQLEVVVQKVDDKIPIQTDSSISKHSKYDNEESSATSEKIELVSQSSNENITYEDNLKENAISTQSEVDDKSQSAVLYQQLPQNDPEEVEIVQPQKEEDSFNFICLENDDDYYDIYKGEKEHMLMLIGKSGQSKLIRHKLILRLVKLKWRYIPRFVYHCQTVMHLLFLVLYLYYIIHEFDAFRHSDNVNNSTNSSLEDVVNKINENEAGHFSNYVVLVFTVLLLVYFLVYEFFEALSEKFAYLLSIKNWLECLTYILALIVVAIIKFESMIQLASLLGSIAVLFGFIVLMLRLEKNSHFGSYVVRKILYL